MSSKKPERLHDVEKMLLDTHTGLSKSELADRLGVHTKTIGRYLDELSEIVPVEERPDGMYRIDRGRYTAPMRVSVHDSVGMFIALRHLTNRMNILKPHASGAIRTISEAVRGVSREIADSFRDQSRDLDRQGTAQHGDRFVRILEVVTLAWVNREKVSIIHLAPETDEHDEVICGVHAIFPCALRADICLIVGIGEEDIWRSVWIEDIRDAELLDETFVPAKPFVWTEFLTAAKRGNVLFGKGEEVELRFSAAVATQVEGVLWHPSQKTKRLGHGMLSWTGTFQNPEKDLFPWVRSWGTDVEIIRPDSLRELFSSELQRISELYEELDSVELL